MVAARVPGESLALSSLAHLDYILVRQQLKPVTAPRPALHRDAV
jgi:hypothetical protein